MPLGVTLLKLRKELRAETGQTLHVYQNVQAQETQDIIMDRQQRELWDAYDWPHLRYMVDVPLASGQQTYAYPPTMPFDQIGRIYVAQGSSGWKELAYGIRAYDVPVGGATLGTPVRWQHEVSVSPEGITQPEGMIKLLPIPNSNTFTMRLEGQAPCTTLSADTDKCIIDSKAIVLFAAAEIMAVAKSEAAALKLTKAQNYLRKLLVNQGADKRANYSMGGSYRVDHLAVRPWANVPGIGYVS